MLTQIQHYLDNPEDIPAIPRAASEFLQAHLNMAYLVRAGQLDELRAKGFSESAILGFLEGVNAAIEVIEMMEEAQRQQHEDEQINY